MNHWPGTNIPKSRGNAFDVAFGTSTLAKDGGVKYAARKTRAEASKPAAQRNAETVEFKRVALVGQPVKLKESTRRILNGERLGRRK